MSDFLVTLKLDRLIQAVTAQTEVLKTLNDNVAKLMNPSLGEPVFYGARTDDDDSTYKR